nr:hypothetical protein [Rhizobium sp. FKY42]
MATKWLKTRSSLPFCVLMAISITGCAGAPKEKTAPCKRPANLTSYAEDPRQKCPEMTRVNGNYSQALAAIDALAGSGKQ